MLPALTTKPKQAVRQVKGLSNDSIDSYANTPLGASGIGAATYVDNTESGSTIARGSPPASNRSTINSGRSSVSKPSTEGATLARVVRDRKASGEEELSLRTGDIVKVLSSKRTGYLKCEAGDEVGYIPSSYLEFLDEVENTNGTEETQRAAEKQRKKQLRKEKRKKEKREAIDASDPEEGAPVSARSPRKEVPAEDEGLESPRKSKKKTRKHRQDRDGDDARAAASGVEEAPTSTRSRTAPEDTERSRSKSKLAKKKRHRDAGSSESSESDGGKRSARHGRRRRHRRGSSDSDSASTCSDDSDGSYRRRRRRRRHRHRRSSSEEEDEDDSDHKRRSKRNKKRREKGGGESEPEEGSRSARKSEKKLAAALQEAEKGVSQLDVKSDEKASEPVQAKATASSIKKEEPDRERGKKEETERSEGSSEGRTTNISTGRKDDEGRTSTGTSSSKHNSTKSGLGRQIGDKMRSFLGGSKKQQTSKGSSGILNACTGTVQGEEGWYEHGENERYYFVLVDGKWSLLYGPMTEDDFEVFSNRVLEQNRSIELPPTYLHKTGYHLNRDLRVQKES